MLAVAMDAGHREITRAREECVDILSKARRLCPALSRKRGGPLSDCGDPLARQHASLRKPHDSAG